MSPHAPAEVQRGAALVVGLVLLMVLTVLAISVMRTAALDLAMTGNAQFRENAFQLAESGTQSLIRNYETGTLDLNAVPACPPPAVPRPWSDADLPWGAAVDVPQLRGRFQTRICFEGVTDFMYGTSLGQQRHYRVEARGRTDQRNAEAINVQGFFDQEE